MRKAIFLPIVFLSLSVAVFSQGKEDARCPSISIEGPVGLTLPGNPIPFEAKVGDEVKKYNPTYHWSTSTGKIIEGQGTRSIKVVQSKEEPRDITVSLEVSGLPPDCPNLVSESGNGGDKPAPAEMLADFSPAEKDLGSEQIYDMASRLKTAPNSQLFVLAIFIRGASQEKIHSAINPLRTKLLGSKQIDPDSLTFLSGFADEDRVKIYLVPPEADAPDCEGCNEFKDFDQVSCPKITVDGPAGKIRAGSTAIFAANVDVGDDQRIAYKWTVNDGIVESGQGTPVISVRTNREPNVYSLAATVTVSGLSNRCSTQATGTASWAVGDPTVADEYGRISFRDEKARLDNIAAQLKTNSKFCALFIIYITKGETNSVVVARVRRIQTYFATRLGIVANRLKFVFSERDFSSTRIYLLLQDSLNDFPDVVDSLQTLRPNRR